MSFAAPQPLNETTPVTARRIVNTQPALWGQAVVFMRARADMDSLHPASPAYRLERVEGTGKGLHPGEGSA